MRLRRSIIAAIPVAAPILIGSGAAALPASAGPAAGRAAGPAAGQAAATGAGLTKQAGPAAATGMRLTKPGLEQLGQSFAIVDTSPLDPTIKISPDIGAATGLEFLGDGQILAAAEPVRRGGGSAGVVHPAG
jgi:hypothetical protein